MLTDETFFLPKATKPYSFVAWDMSPYPVSRKKEQNLYLV